jgi:hypothetical protein
MQFHRAHVHERDAHARRRPNNPAADVRISLEGPARDARFIIANWGRGAARNIDLTITPRVGRSDVLVRGDDDEKFANP